MALYRTIKRNLNKFLKNSDIVFIVPHNRPDIDALSSCLAMSLICEKNGKKPYIVVEDDFKSLESVTKSVFDEVYHEVNFIKKEDVFNLKNDKSSVVVLDTNKKYMICLGQELDQFKDVFVIDHHKPDDKTIRSKYLFIDDKLSSTSEVMSLLLKSYGIKPNNYYSNYLLAGMILDSNRFSKNVSINTLKAELFLLKSKADVRIANNMFSDNYEHNRMVNNLLENATFGSFTYAISYDKDNVYLIEDIAKAADNQLNVVFDDHKVDVSFAIAKYTDDRVYICARSRGAVDVSKIMSLFEGGGGNEMSARASISNMSVEEVSNKLNNILTPYNKAMDKNIEMSLKKQLKKQ